MKTTLSGAIIIECDDYVVKLGDGRVGVRIHEQMNWLEAHACVGIIPITRLTQYAYTMPHAEEWPDPVDTRAAFDGVVNLLKTYVWNNMPEVVNPPEFALKENTIRAWGGAPDQLIDVAVELRERVDWMTVPRTLTHGDPTFHNTLWLKDRLVLCDPVPANTTIPDIRAVDLGKLLQSCFGFETIMHGWSMTEPPNPAWVREVVHNDNEWNAAVYCGVLHILRMLPYIKTQPLIEEFTRVALEMSRLGS